MPMPLKDALADPTLVAAEPTVLSGAGQLDRVITWVHTSEVLDIAALLRGGEFLLVGGVSLATASPMERVAYVRDLARHNAAGIAIETGDRLPAVPPEMVAEAERLDFPLIRLGRVVRFVEVTQAINGLLVNESVRRMQLADQISHALALGMAGGADLPQLMQILASEAQADTTLTAVSGEVLAEVRSESDDAEPPSVPPVVAPVSSGGVTVALLTLTPRPGANLLLLDAALDRAPESLGLAMLRHRPLSRVERDTHEFLGLVRTANSPARRRLAELAVRLGIDNYDAWVPLLARTGPGQSLTTGIEAVVGRPGRHLISEIEHDLHTCVIAVRLSGGTLAAARQAIISELRSVALSPQVTIAVGPGTLNIHHIAYCLREAGSTLDLTDESHPVVADSVALGLTRLISALDRDRAVSTFVTEQIGDLISADEERGSRLFDTFATYLRYSGSKTKTAAALHLQRQSVYQRLDRIMALLAHPLPGSNRWAAVALAVELEIGRRRLAGEFSGLRG